MKNRTTDYYRYQKEKHIKRKKDIVKYVYLEDPELNNAYKQSRLHKGKIHCSCSMCQSKTKKLGWKATDKRNLDKGRE